MYYEETTVLMYVCTCTGMYVCSDTVSPEILAGIKFGGLAPNRYCKNISRFKFGSSVRDCHTYICE